MFWVLKRTVSLSTLNICFGCEITKIVFQITLSSGDLILEKIVHVDKNCCQLISGGIKHSFQHILCKKIFLKNYSQYELYNIYNKQHMGFTTHLTLSVCTQVYINKNFQRKIVDIFLPINFNICFGCSKEPSH